MAIAVVPVRHFVTSSTPVRSEAAREDILEIWKAYKADPTSTALRNRLVEEYLPLVKYNGERIWARCPTASNWTI